MRKIKKLEELINLALIFDKDILVHYALSGKDDYAPAYSPDELLQFEKEYKIIDGVISFVYKGTHYVIPNIPGSKDTLESEGFKNEDELNVPFSFFNTPVEEKYQWDELLELKNKN